MPYQQLSHSHYPRHIAFDEETLLMHRPYTSDIDSDVSPLTLAPVRGSSLRYGTMNHPHTIHNGSSQAHQGSSTRFGVSQARHNSSQPSHHQSIYDRSAMLEAQRSVHSHVPRDLTTEEREEAELRAARRECRAILRMMNPRRRRSRIGDEEREWVRRERKSISDMSWKEVGMCVLRNLAGMVLFVVLLVASLGWVVWMGGGKRHHHSFE